MARKRDGLATYRSRRDFRKSPEPSGAGSSGNGPPRFVIHQHDARTLHWDFRIEVDGVLKSWALPKGPSTDPRHKRLAVAVEDHPLEYADFEGVIPEGEYGAGAVIVWDAGPYENLTVDDAGREIPVAKAIEEGHLEIRIEGRKLTGGFALVHGRLGGKKENWLLVKMKGEGADARRKPTSTEPESVLSGRTVEQVADDEGEKEGDG